MRTQGKTVFHDHFREIRDGRLRHVVQWQRRLLPHDAQKLIPRNRAEPCADRTFSFVPLPIFHRLIECFLREFLRKVTIAAQADQVAVHHVPVLLICFFCVKHLQHLPS